MNTVIESRVNLLRLAECCLALESQGVPVTSKANLLATCVDCLADIFVANGAIPRVEDHADAADIVSRMLGPKTFNPEAYSVRSVRQSVLDEVEKLKKQRKEKL